jgi:hypothetical protein
MTAAAVLAAQRRMTMALIKDDPTAVVLVPRVETLTSSGTKSYVDGTPRASQQVKLSLLGGDGSGSAGRPTATLGGVERIIDYHLIAAHNAVIEAGDYWIDAEGTRFEVVGFSEGWDYEIKALVVRHVPKPANP